MRKFFSIIIAWLISGFAIAQDLYFEAESAQQNGTEILTEIPGYSGTGYVGGFDVNTDNFVLNVNVSTSRLCEIFIRYSAPYGTKDFTLEVNGGASTGTMVENDTWSEVSAGKFLLVAGDNEVKLVANWGWYLVDMLRVSDGEVAPPIPPMPNLHDQQATPSAVALYGYLKSVYGTKTLSGQQTIEEIQYIESITGKTPAVGAFDLIDYSPSRVEFQGQPTGYTESVINWSQQGNGLGIITLSWHWNAPTDLINEEPDKQWWRGFYTEATTFDIAAALSDPESERYQLILRDIDAIAVELKKFDDEGIPVLWRPLHEAEGGWFWWGAKGAAPFKDLWQLLHDRLVNHHQLHNLIWVYTAGNSADWYPGDDYVDIVGLDIYAPEGSSMSSNWDALQTQLSTLQTDKMVALSETGAVPVPDKIRAFGTRWSWFVNWSGDFIRNQNVNTLNLVYHDDDVITRDELPNWYGEDDNGGGDGDGDGGGDGNGGSLPHGNYYMVNENSGMAMYVLDWSTANGANIVQWDFWSMHAQQFRVENVEDGYVKLISNWSNNCLEISNENVQQNGCTDADNQLWKISKVGDDNYNILNKSNGKAVMVESASTSTGANIAVGNYTEGDEQLWRFVAVNGSVNLKTAAAEQIQAVKIYPNPASKVLQVEMPRQNTEGAISLYNVYGSEVLRVNSVDGASVSLDVAALKEGVYWLEFKSSSWQWQRKVIINH